MRGRGCCSTQELHTIPVLSDDTVRWNFNRSQKNLHGVCRVRLCARAPRNDQNLRLYDGDTSLGKEIDWQNLANSYIGGAVAPPGKTLETKRALNFYLKRDFQ